MDAIRAAIESAKARGWGVWSAGAGTEREITRLEKELGVTLPSSYRSFLGEFGALALGDVFISGIIDGDALTPAGGSLLWETREARSERSLPAHLVIFQMDEDAPYCFDASTPAQGELPVVSYEWHSGAITRLAPTFSEWAQAFLP